MPAATELRETADVIGRYPAQAVRHVVEGLGRAIDKQLRRDSGGDYRLSGARGKKRMKVETDVAGSVGTVTAGPRRLLGPWRWLNDGTKPHGAHPGTAAKRTFDAPAEKAIPQLELEISDQFTTLIR